MLNEEIILQKIEDCMARIKDFVTPAGAKSNKIEFEHKIKAHRRGRFLKITSIGIVVVLFVGALIFLWKNAIYTSYSEISSYPRISSSDSVCLNHNGKVLSYSKDGISSMDTKGNLVWNETYQMQDPIVEVNGNAVAVGDYNGHIIYVMDEKGKVGEVDTNLPIRDLCVSKTGIVAAVLKDSKLTRLNLYDPKGKELVKSECRMSQNGYPVAVALSDTGEVMEVSYLYVDSGVMRSGIGFYNFGAVGQNELHNYVSGFNYTDSVVPYVKFLNNEIAVAVADDRIMFYKGDQKPAVLSETLLSEQILSVYTGKEYVGLVYENKDGVTKYYMDLYNIEGEKEDTLEFDCEYTDIVITEKTILIYNKNEWNVYTIGGRMKFSGTYENNIRKIIPTNHIENYMIVTDETLETVILK